LHCQAPGTVLYVNVKYKNTETGKEHTALVKLDAGNDIWQLAEWVDIYKPGKNDSSYLMFGYTRPAWELTTVLVFGILASLCLVWFIIVLVLWKRGLW
jgi:hypothetical protein